MIAIGTTSAGMGFFDSPTPRQAVLSPCIGICNLDADGLCEGCHRTANEIASWSTLNDSARLSLMLHVLPEREAKRTA